ncbi:MAG TPA: aminotransferase class V-fold PLP-dependent enzyme [Pirellulales bacterium]|nr:aminotransferase class V-fold PLP-dependent enzyme [Pirellulales bacterium]
MLSNDPWSDFRRQMPSAGSWACFDHAAVAPLSGPAREAIVAWADDLAENGAANWPRWAERIEATRRRGAQGIGAEAGEVALVRSTTEGINFVAEGFPWRSGDNLVVPANEFPSNLYPWMHLADRGVETRRVPVEQGRVGLDDLASACDRRTRIIAVSWVGYAGGWRMDLDALVELAHARGALVFLDAIQGLGVFPLDVRRTPVDFLAADGHKWLLGPEGAGLFYLRREHLGLLRPVGVGWNSVVQTLDFSHIELKLKPTAGRYEGGTYNMAGFAALGASLELLARYPAAAVASRVLKLTDEICRRLRDLGAVVASCRDEGRASGIVAFDLAGQDPIQLRKRCRERRVLLSCRGGRLRVSPHAYNNDEDIDRLIEALRAG